MRLSDFSLVLWIPCVIVWIAFFNAIAVAWTLGLPFYFGITIYILYHRNPTKKNLVEYDDRIVLAEERWNELVEKIKR